MCRAQKQSLYKVNQWFLFKNLSFGIGNCRVCEDELLATVGDDFARNAETDHTAERFGEEKHSHGFEWIIPVNLHCMHTFSWNELNSLKL